MIDFSNDHSTFNSNEIQKKWIFINSPNYSLQITVLVLWSAHHYNHKLEAKEVKISNPLSRTFLPNQQSKNCERMYFYSKNETWSKIHQKQFFLELSKFSHYQLEWSWKFKSTDFFKVKHRIILLEMLF
jgi:hypothetical protein